MPFIYALRNRTTDLVYYGSTTLTLPKRLAVHRVSHHSSHQIADCPTAYIEAVEEVSVGDRYARERWWIENHPCVNRNIPNQTSVERKRAYYLAHQDEIKAKRKEHYLANREKKIAYATEYKRRNR